MKLKYTIILLSLTTPLAAETDCLEDKNETPYEIISCLNQRGIENAKAITKKAVEIKALTDLVKKQREEIKTQQNLIQAQQENIKTLTEQLKKKLDVNDGWHGSFSFGSKGDDGGRMYSTYEKASPFLNFIEYDDPFVFRFKQTKDNDQVLISFHNGKVGIDTTPQHKLDVNGSIRGNNLHFLRCGGRYKCTPRMCLDLCIKKGLRMATYDEVYAWASTGKNHCKYMWMLHSQHPNKVFSAYPMYNNRTSGGCGRPNTGNIPRMEGINVFDWNSSQKSDCACAGIK
jgi:hypothetical protein